MQTITPKHKLQQATTGSSCAGIHVIAILLAGLIAYSNSFTVPMQLDDYRTLGNSFKNLTSGGIGLLSGGSSRWVVDATFALERYSHGYWLYGYHIVNLMIHLSAALVVYGLLGLILDASSWTTSSPREHSLFDRFVPVATALLFVCHPIQTEAVTYICQRYTSLAAMFYLLALLCYFKARRELLLFPTLSLFRNGLIWWLIFTVSAFLAMKCKHTSFTLPVVVAILESVFFRGYLFKKLPFLVLLLALFVVVPIQEISSSRFATSNSLSQTLQQASFETEAISRYSYFLTQQRVEVTYLRLLLFPINQNLDYDYHIFSSIKEWPVVVSLLVNLFLICLALYFLIRSKRKTHDKTSEDAMLLAGVGIIWFYVTLSVESSFFPISDVIFEHRLYLPSVGFFLAVTAVGCWLAIRYLRTQRLVWYALTVVAITLITATILRNNVWNSDLGMWQDVLEKSPNKARSRHFAGTLYLKRNMLDQSIYNFVRAIELDPVRDLHRISLNHTIATMFPEFAKRTSTGGKYQSEFERVDPVYYSLWLAVSYNNLGLAYELLNNPVRATYNYTLAVSTNPDLDIAWYNLALSASRRHDTKVYNQAVSKLKQLNPQLLSLLGP